MQYESFKWELEPNWPEVGVLWSGYDMDGDGASMEL